MTIGLCMGVGLFSLLKDSFFLSSFFLLEKNSLFMIAIFPLVLFMIISPSFFHCGGHSSVFSSTVFYAVIFSLACSFVSSSSFFFLVFLECCVIFMISYIFIMAKDQDKISSTIFMLLLNMIPSVLFMYFCGVFSGSLYSEAFSSCSVNSSLFLCFFLILLASKLPLFLIHFWLTKAHVSASGPGSMILASLLLKIGGVGLYKFYSLFLGLVLELSGFLFSLPLVGSVVIGILLVRFTDIKFMVACFSVVHMAPIFPLMLVLDSVNIWSCFVMMVGHGIISYFIFFLVSFLYEFCHSKSSFFSKSIECLDTSFLLFLVLFFLMNMGFPPFISFMSELLFSLEMFNFSLGVLILFSVSLLLSGLIFYLVVSKFAFGYKNDLSLISGTPFIIFNCVQYLLLFFLVPFFYI